MKVRRRTGKPKILMADALVGNDYSVLLCNHLHQAGVDITLATTTDRDIKIPVHFPLKRWIPSKDPKIGRVSKAVRYLLYLARLLCCGISRRYDVIHFQFFRFETPETLFLPILRLSGVPVVHTAHNVVHHERRPGDRAIKAILYRTAKHLIVHSETIRLRLIQTFGIPAGKATVIPHGNFDAAKPEPTMSRRIARDRMGLAAGDQVLLFFGYIRQYKGLDILLAAFEIAYRQNQRLRLLIAGKCQTDQMEKAYNQQISGMTAKDAIHFHSGFVPREKIPQYFNASDWVMLPYRHIDHSGIIHLAYAYGRPVIASDLRGLSEMIAEDGTGYVTPASDPEKLADTILRAVSNPADSGRMGERGRRLGETKYSWDRAAKLTRQVYREILY